MRQDDSGWSALSIRPFSFLKWGCVLAFAASLAGQGHAMWARMSEAELIQKSQWIVVGEWMGQAPLRSGQGAATSELGVIVVAEVLRGPQGGLVAFVALPDSGKPVSSSDLRYQRGDRGVWFLRQQQPGDAAGPYLVDHPQRFLRDSADNAAAIAALRQQLLRR